MSVLNKVLLVLILLTGLVFIQFASQRYMLSKSNESKIAALQKKQAETEEAVTKLHAEIYGKRLDMETEWSKMCLIGKMNRIKSVLPGSIWANCEVSGNNFKAEKGLAVASFKLGARYDATGVRMKSLVYVFDSGAPYQAEIAVAETAETEETEETEDEEKTVANTDEAKTPDATAPAAKTVASRAPVFLGIFQINNINKSEISIGSVTTLTAEDQVALTKSIESKNSWIICSDRLPIDSPDNIAEWLNEKPELKKLLSAESAEYFARKSYTPADMSKIETVKLDSSKEKRFPIDYNYVFDNGYIKRDMLTAIINRKQIALADVNQVLASKLALLGHELTAEETKLVDKTLFDARKKVNTDAKLESLTARANRLKEELEIGEKERDLVKVKLDNVKSTILAMDQKIDQLLADNCNLAAKIAKAQIFAAKRILRASGKAGNFSLEENNKQDIL